MIENLTEQIYTFIAAYIDEYGYSPSVREIATGCFVSTGAATRHVDKLEAQGRIARVAGRARSIHLLNPESLSE